MTEWPDPIPVGIALCCREWVVPIWGNGGRCGLCGERPEFQHMLPEDEWPHAPQPLREVGKDTEGL